MNICLNPLRSVILIVITFSVMSCHGRDQVKSESHFEEPQAGKIVTVLDKSIWVIFQDKNNHYWFGSNGEGAYYYDGKTLRQYTEEDGLISNQIRAIQSDAEGNIFFDTPIGVSKFTGEKFVSLEVTNSSIDQWKLNVDDLWFRGNGDIEGAYRYTGDTLYFLKFSDFDATYSGSGYGVYCVSKDNSGNIWFGTLSSGVARYDGKSLNWIFEKELSVLDDGRVPAVRSILQDRDGNYWLSNILHKYSVKGNDIHKKNQLDYVKLPGIDLSKQSVTVNLPYYNSAIRDDESGDIWMTNYNEGIWKYDGEKLVKYTINDKQTSALIVSIYRDNKGVPWVGTDNLGIYKFNGVEFIKFWP